MFHPRSAETGFTHPALAIRSGVVEATRCFDQHVETHRKSERILASVVINHPFMHDERTPYGQCPTELAVFCVWFCKDCAPDGAKARRNPTPSTNDRAFPCEDLNYRSFSTGFEHVIKGRKESWIWSQRVKQRGEGDPQAIDLSLSLKGNRSLESFGTGIRQLVILCFAIGFKNEHIVCIEEPESFLHPTLQPRFLGFPPKKRTTPISFRLTPMMQLNKRTLSFTMLL